MKVHLSLLFAGLLLTVLLVAGGAGPTPARASNSLPTIHCPSDMQTNSAAGQCGVEVSFDPTANGSPTPVVQCYTNGVPITTSHFFPIGETTVACTADNGNGTDNCSFKITVLDAEPPIISCPTVAPTVEEIPGGGTAVVSFDTPSEANFLVSDNCPDATAVCAPPSGSTFNVGATPVTCVTTDASGNTNSCTFDVVVCPVTNVVTSLADIGPGTLREAIDMANDCPGTNYIVFSTNGTLVLTRPLPELNDPLFLLGPGPTNLSVVRSDDPATKCFSIFYLNDSDIVWISGLTISNGCDSYGAGLYNTGFGVVSNCVFTGNHAEIDGGAIYNETDLIVVDCSIVGNSALNRGAGIYTLSSLLVVERSVIDPNIAENGGGLFVGGGDVALTNLTFSGNIATNGGAIYLRSFSSFVAVSVTIASNTAFAAGGGIFDDANGTAELKNVIVAGNTAPAGPDVDGALVSLGHNLIGDGTDSVGFIDGTMGDQVGTSGSPIDPLLGPLQNNGGPTLTHALTPASPAFNAGTNALAPATDQRGAGFPRVIDGTIDIGAYEAQVCDLPLVRRPMDQQACYLSPATFSITVTSALPYTVQWCEGDFPIHDATNNTFTVDEAYFDTEYSVKVQNACGTVTNRAQLLVLYADLYGPDDAVICPGEPAAFLVEVDANVPFTLEWCKDGVPLPGETNALLILSNTTPASAGVYSAKLTSQCGVFTNSAVLSITNPPPGTLVFLPGGVGFPDVKRGAVRWGDYDKDGLLDLLVIGEDSSGEHVFHNNGNGTFSGSGAVIDDLIFCDAAWADFDKDGFLDFVISGQQGFGPTPTVTKVYQNLGGTNFVEIMASLPGARSGSVAWGDANNDTFPDLLIAGIEEPGFNIFTALYLNDTTGDFTNSGAVLPGIIFGKASFADYDKDGFLDILVTGANTSFNEFTQLLRNNQNGQFIDSGVVLQQLRDSSAAWGDCNNDLFPDLLLLGWDTSQPGFPRYSILYTNDGSGGLFDSMAGLPGVAFGAAAWGDYDGDGFQDFALSGSGENDIFTRIFRNTGNCQFVDSGLDLVPVEDSALDWGDFDKDGDLDLITAGGADLGGEGTDTLTLLYRNCQPKCDLTARLESDCVLPPASFQATNPACMVAVDGAPHSYLKITLSNVPPGFSVQNGMYPSWCVDYRGTILVGHVYKALLYLSTDPLPPSLQHTNWDRVNYILNHKQGNAIDVQAAIWHFIGGPVPASDPLYSPPSAAALALIADAQANGAGFVPGPGQVTAVILDLGSDAQRNVIEVLCRDLFVRGIGENITLCSVPSGTGPFQFAWTLGRQLLPQTNACLTLTNLNFAQTGLYCGVVTSPCGSVTTCMSVMVRDLIPPVIACSAPIRINVSSTQTQAVVNFTVTATDNVDGPVPVICQPPSGSAFALGVTTINCAAADSSGNTNRCSFAVTVQVARGINLVGNAVTIEGLPWLGYPQALASGLSVVQGITGSVNFNFPIVPAPDADTLAMLQGVIWRGGPPNGQGFTLNQTVSNGAYDVYLWMVENYQSNYRNMNVRIEGVQVASNLGDLPRGHWQKYGPYTATVSDGVLSIDILRATKGDPSLCGLLIVPQGGVVSPPPANTPPMVALTNPPSGSAMLTGGSVNLQASASDPGGAVANVEFFSGTTKLGEDNSAPYAYLWANVPAGLQSLTAVATDNAGARATSAVVSLNVTNAPAPPAGVLGINLAGNAVTIEGNLWKSYAQALASGLSVVQGGTGSVNFNFPIVPSPDADTLAMLQGVVWRGGPPNGQGFTLNQTVNNGAYDVYLWMVENFQSNYRDMNVRLEGAPVASNLGDLPRGHWRKYGPFSTTVSDGVLTLDILRATKGDPSLCGLLIVPQGVVINTPPMVALTNPPSGSAMLAGGSVNLQASASDPGGSVANVEFFSGTTKLGEDNSTPFAYLWANVPAGLQSLTAVATDNAGARATSAVVSLNVTNAPAPAGVLGINLVGGAVTIEGNLWKSYTQALASGLSVVQGITGSVNFNFPIVPSPDADTLAMLQGVVWRGGPPDGQGFTLNQTVSNGAYDVYLWMVENFQSNYRDMNVRLEGAQVASNLGDLPRGHWRKYGPFTATVSDGGLTIDILRATKGDPSLCGLLIVPKPPIPSPRRPVLAPQISLSRVLDGRISLRVQGEPGARYTVETSTNLTEWSSLLAITLDEDTLEMPGLEVEPVVQRFYRVRREP